MCRLGQLWVWLAAAAALAACGGDDGGGGSGSSVDAAAPDATEIDAGQPDAAQPDAMREPDAGPPDATPPDASLAQQVDGYCVDTAEALCEWVFDCTDSPIDWQILGIRDDNVQDCIQTRSDECAEALNDRLERGTVDFSPRAVRGCVVQIGDYDCPRGISAGVWVNEWEAYRAQRCNRVAPGNVETGGVCEKTEDCVAGADGCIDGTCASCHECELGMKRCDGDVLEACSPRPGGCAVWDVEQDCIEVESICAVRADLAVCVDNRPIPPAEALDIDKTKVGNPTWDVAGFQNFTGAVGFPDNGFAEAIQTLSAVLAPRAAFSVADSIFLTGAPSEPPYDGLFADGLAAMENTSRMRFLRGEFTAPQGVLFGFVAIPGEGAPAGRTPDVEDGPMIGGPVFPIELVGELRRNGVPLDNMFGVLFPGPGDLAMPLEVDGYSYLAMFTFANTLFLPEDAEGPVAEYEWRVSALDADAAGWTINLAFRVE